MAKYGVVYVAVLLVVMSVAAESASSLPAGFATYFRSSSCPTGWSPLPDAAGRLIVSVSDPSISGLTLGTPLGDKEDRVHTHGFTAMTTLPEKHVAAIDCCNDQAAGHGSYTGNGTSDKATSGLPFTQMVFCRLDNSNSTYQVPFGTVAYFDSTVAKCPPSWDTYTTADGRTLVPGYKAVQGTTKSLSKPLSSMENRQHSHTFTTSMETDSVSFAGVDGCCNDNPAGAGTVTTSGTAEEASGDLPYIQLLTCYSLQETFDVTMPDDALLWNPLTGCPKGYQVASELSGRMLVPLPTGGEVGASFGGTSIGMNNVTEPAHNHLVEGVIPTTGTGVGLGSGCCASGYAKATSYPFTATSTQSDVDFPWMMITMCEAV